MDKSSLQWRWIIYVVYLPFDTKDCSMEIKKTALTRNSFLFPGITQITQSLCAALHAPTLYRSIMMSFRMSLMVKLEALPSPHTHTLSNMAIPMNECFFPGIHPSVIKDDCCKVARGRILSGNSILTRRSDFCCSAKVITCSAARWKSNGHWYWCSSLWIFMSFPCIIYFLKVTSYHSILNNGSDCQ